VALSSLALLARGSEAGAAPAAPGTGSPVAVRPDLTVQLLRPGVWSHVSIAGPGPLEGIPANGLLAEIDGGLLLVDTTWNDEQVSALVDWAQRELHRPVVAAVATHSHGDRTGGLGALRRRGIPVGGLDLTAARAAQAGMPALEVLLSTAEPVRRDARGFELFYPGPGHAADNIVVWLPRAQVLFGGCFVKDAAAEGLGNVADADLGAWPGSIEAVRRRYAQAAVVVPGHGPVGDKGALEHTLELLRRAAAAAPERH